MNKLWAVLKKLVQYEFSGGLFLIIISILAILIANSALSGIYFKFLNLNVVGLTILYWVNDGLMALFFLIVGLEIKRELIAGQLSTKQQRILPTVAALGGMIVPAIIYLLININMNGIIKGWAIPTATDIAFSLGILSLLGSKVPTTLKVFLTALAIIDDLGAVLIIALFYTSNINMMALLGVIIIIIGLFILNRMNINKLAPYLIFGAVLWFFMLKSGVHATIAGVLLALFIPFKQNTSDINLSVKLENKLHHWVTFLIIPIFGFANAGVSFDGVNIATLLNPITLGIMLGLFFGKQFGVFIFSYTSIKLGIASLPKGVSYYQMYGVALLCGIGFTMSLFIGSLAFPTDIHMQDATKLGVIFGSCLSAIIGAIVLKKSNS